MFEGKEFEKWKIQSESKEPLLKKDIVVSKNFKLYQSCVVLWIYLFSIILDKVWKIHYEKKFENFIHIETIYEREGVLPLQTNVAGVV